MIIYFVVSILEEILNEIKEMGEVEERYMCHGMYMLLSFQ